MINKIRSINENEIYEKVKRDEETNCWGKLENEQGINQRL
jgi:hypothetical protein